MDSPRIHGDAEEEEKSSCESGWTMYIEDTFHGNNHSDVGEDDDDDDDSRVKEVDDDDDDGDINEDESDDSMTSDASSWPNNTQLPEKTKNHAATKEVNHETKINRVCETFSDQEEESELRARTRTTGASRVRSRGKLSKTK